MEIKISTNYGNIVLNYLGKKFLPNQQQDNWKNYIQNTLHSMFQISKNKIFSLNQVHGDTFLRSSEISLNDNITMEADAMISDEMNELLVIRTADCVPIAIWSYDIPLIANIHSGWKGTQMGILEKTFFHMKEILFSKGFTNPKFGFAIGPRIAGKDYEIGQDVAEFFKGQNGLSELGNNKFQLDLGSIIQAKIRDIAMNPVIVDFSESTYGSEDWFSHRYKDVGRNLNTVRIES
jgi:polyphenol oxidase